MSGNPRSSLSDVAAGPELRFVRNMQTGELVPIEAMELPSIGLEPQPHSPIAKPRLLPIPISINELAIGDVMFVQEQSIVSVSQNVTRFFSGDITRSGSAESVHCAIVVRASSSHAEIAHVTNSGAIATLLLGSDKKVPSVVARVYRMVALPSAKLPQRAAIIASDLTESGNISFSHTNAITSAFRDSLAGRFLSLNSPKISSMESSIEKVTDDAEDKGQRQMQMFCTEFVILSYQKALLELDSFERRALMTAIDIDGSACTPMGFEGFIRRTSETTAQWIEVGEIEFEYG